ncbi:OPA3-domain-containing protein [Hymenopellis radicata]|nr:OPA3-domain-containing protein [Hymenopellis radicata]
MATAKIATLLIRTLAKPISAQIKEQATKHERFRGFCLSLAQRMHRAEVQLRTSLLGEPAKHVRPLSETRAIDSGANALAEGFLFGVAAVLILGETYRSSRNQSKRRDDVDDKLEELGTQVSELTTRVSSLTTSWEEREIEQKTRNDELQRILQRVFEDTPLQLPRVTTVSLPAPHDDRSPLPTDETRIDIDRTPPDSTKPS